MCMSLRIEPREMAEVLIKIRKMSLAQDMSIKLGKSLIMSGDLYPSDIAPVLAPNKYGNIAIFPMAWGFTHKAAPKPLVNCRVETADSKPLCRVKLFFNYVIINYCNINKQQSSIDKNGAMLYNLIT